MATRTLDLTSDNGMTTALNRAYSEFENDGDDKVARTRSALVGRGVSIRNLRLREEQFKRSRGKRNGA